MSQEKRKTSDSNRNQLILFGIIAVVALLAVLFILMSNQSGSSLAGNIDYSAIQQERLDDGGFVLGDPNAQFVLVAFEDFLCPHCQTYKPVVDEFIEKYVVTGQARFEYRILPAVDPTWSVVAGQFAACAEDLGGSFWTAHDEMFALASSERFSQRTAQIFADNMGLSYTDLLECSETQNQPALDQQLAQRVGAQGTPYVMYRLGDATNYTPISGNQRDIESLGALVSTFQ